ncbi:hypothetical protein DYB30_000038 [Aphanomyces astaci]|uniref:WW domain-containing protein n=1 Tax=Aphanomyces astaci TaxID=112090 RepID=A0A397E931_APHAT|nr:hypothetical protein DYB30_000038 [Aphanomyces astaci]
MQRCRSEGPLSAAADLFLVSPSKRRIRDIIELNRSVNLKLEEQAHVEQVAQRAKYYTRWKHLRDIYTMYTLNKPPPTSPTRSEAPPSPTQHAGSPRRRKCNHGGPLMVACVELCVDPLVPVLVMTSIMYSALGLDARVPATQTLVQEFLKCMQVSHPCKQPSSFFVDHRVICCMWDVLAYPTFPPLRRLTRWFDTFCIASTTLPLEAVVHPQDIRSMLFSACPTPASETAMDVFVKHLVAAVGDSHLRLPQLMAFADARFDLQVLVRRLCWENLTESQREAIEKDESDMTAAFVERERLAVQHTKALTYWIHMEPRRRFMRWKQVQSRPFRHIGGDVMCVDVQFTQDMVRLKTADRHARRYKYGRGVMYLEANARRVRWMKQSLVKAMTCHTRTLALTTFDGWVCFSVGCYELYEATISCLNVVLAKTWNGWRYFVELQKLDRMSQQRQDDMVAAAAEFQRFQHECSCMDREDALATRVKLRCGMRQGEWDDVERARKAMFREQARQVYEVRKVKKQEETRTALKKEREDAKAQLAQAAWTDIEHMAVAKARAAAEEWLQSPQGKRRIYCMYISGHFNCVSGQIELHAAATDIYEDPPTNVAKMLQTDSTYSNVPDCVWVCRLENIGGRHAKVVIIVHRIMGLLCDDLTMKSSVVIASEHLIQARINAMKAQLAQRGQEEQAKFTRNAAAKRIQMLFRCRQARKYVRSLLRPLVMKRIDAATGRLVYFNIQERKTSPVPPRLMGAAEATLPVESATWVRRLDADSGDQYYMDVSTGDTSWNPPNSYVMCKKCKINFCTSRNTETGERLCVSCYAEVAQLQRQADKAARAASSIKPDDDNKSTWTRIAVVPSKCYVCKVNNGERLCHECRGDITCARCFATLHKNPKLKHHTQHESLVYSDLQ